MRLLFCFWITLLIVSTIDAAEKPWQTQRIHRLFHAEGASAGDIDGDGKVDLVAGPLWYRGPQFNEAFPIAQPTEFPIEAYSDQFFSSVFDANQDGHNDVLVLGFPGKEARLYLNPGPQGLENNWSQISVADIVDNESPAIQDVNGDQFPEIICGREGRYGYYQAGADPTEKWSWHPVTGQGACSGRFAHALGVGDVNGDGRPDLLDKQFWWEQPAEKTDVPWQQHRWTEGNYPGGAQICVIDLDADGDNDIVTSLQAHGYGLAWFEQQTNGSFVPHEIMGSSSVDNDFGVVFSQLHAVAVADVDGDQRPDIITGKRWMAHRGKDPGALQPPVLYWFQNVETEQGIQFLPRQIDHDSGVGVDLLVTDLNADQKLDVISCSKRGLAIHLQQAGVAAEQPQAWKIVEGSDQSQYANGLGPQQAAQNMQVPTGFHVDLIAAEPLLTQPIAMTFDARGRIWILEGHTYPIRAEEGQGKDRIIILEDADADGSFETHKVFMEGLNLASGIEIGFGGVWVGAAPYLLFIPDADRDDIPDAEPQVLLDGWGYQDTHETLNSFTWGPDGWLYGCHGVFTHSRVGKPGTADADRVPINAGVWRYHPTQHRFEVFAHGTSNPWGVDFNDQGEWFVTACVIPHLYHIQKHARYQRQAGQHFNPYTYDDIKTIADHAHYTGSIRDHAFWGDNKMARRPAPAETSLLGGGHAHCGLTIYNGDAFPDEYHGDLFFHNLHGHRVVREKLMTDGSGFVGLHQPDFARARDHQVIGVTAAVGPDGAIYTSDWHDPQTCHNRSPEIWDRTDGRLFRIRYGSVRPQKLNLWEATDLQLVSQLKNDNGFIARQTQRILMERQADGSLHETATAEALKKLFHSASNQRDRLRAQWALWNIAAVDQQLLSAWLMHEEEYVRYWAVHFAAEAITSGRPLMTVAELVQQSVAETSPVVRRVLASTLQDLPENDRWELLAALSKHSIDQHDRNIPWLLWYGMEPLVTADPQRAYEIASQPGWDFLLRFTVRRMSDGPIGRNMLVGKISQQTPVSVKQMVLEELFQSATSRGGVEMPDNWPAAYEQLMKNSPPAVQETARLLAVEFGDTAVIPYYRDQIIQQKLPPRVRLHALSALKKVKDPELPTLVFTLLKTPALAPDAVAALGAYQNPEIAEVLLDRYSEVDVKTQAAILNTLATRKNWAAQLVSQLSAQKIPAVDVPAYIVKQILTFNDQNLNDQLQKSWGQISQTSEQTKQQYEFYKSFLTPPVISRANASNGRLLYEANCGKCHKLFGVGGEIGPEITGANRSQRDYWLENILEPNALIGKAFEVTTFVTVDGRVLSGFIKQENESAYTIQTVNEQIVLPKAEIEEYQTSKVSLMPENQLKPMTQQQVLDLFKYLMSPQQVPLPAPQ